MGAKWLATGGIVLSVAVLVGGAGAFYWWMKRMAPAPAIRVGPVVLPSGAEVRLAGKLQAVNVLQVSAPIEGVVEEFAVKPGDEVYEGQIVGRIANDSLAENERESAIELDRAQSRVNGAESEMIAARLEESRASADAARIATELARSEKNYQRQAQLMKEGAIARNVYQKAEQEYMALKGDAETLVSVAEGAGRRIKRAASEVEVARKLAAEKEQAHDEAKAELASANLLSPVDGLVIAIHANAGDAVTKTRGSLVDIASDLSQMELVVDANPAVAARVAAGQPAVVEMAELPGEGLSAKVKVVEGGRIVVEFSSPSPLVRPGMSAVARLKLR